MTWLIFFKCRWCGEHYHHLDEDFVGSSLTEEAQRSAVLAKHCGPFGGSMDIHNCHDDDIRTGIADIIGIRPA